MQSPKLSSLPVTLGLVLGLIPTVLASQDKMISSPPGYETKGQPRTPSATNDRTWGYRLGQFASERFQAADGMFRNKVLVIKEIAYRLDQRTYKADVVSAGVGRTWTQVTLAMSECDYDKLTKTYSTNSLTAAKEVFNAKVSWATQVGNPTKDPAPWGGNGHKFPFKSSWIYSGKKDLLLDYRFRGGALANKASWSSSTSIRYYLDGYYATTFNLGSATEYPASPSKTTPANCMDSAFTSNTDAARNDIQGIFVYSADRASRPKQAYLQWRSFFTAPGAAVIKAVSFGGIAVGVPAGARCNRLYLNLTQPHGFILQTAGSTGKSPFSILATPFTTTLGGQTLWFQCAWEDSKSKAFSLTTATARTIPNTIPLSSPRRSALYYWDANASTGTGPVSNGASWGANPMYMITYQ